MVRVLRAGLRAIQEAAEVVRSGGLIIYPTDTVYGLGCDPLNEHALKRVFRAKGREFNKPLPILASDIRQAGRIAVLEGPALELARAFWPGALTLVVPKKPSLPDLVTCGRPSVGVRVPGLAFTRELIRACGGLLVGTSANKSGHPPPRTAQEAIQELGREVDLAVDGGPAPLGKPSTVVDLTGPEPKVLRIGAIKPELLMVFLKPGEG